MDLIYWIIIAAVLLIGGTVFMLIYTMGIAKRVYADLLVKTSPDKWTRECSAPEIEEHYGMYLDGVKWAETFSDKIKEVSIENEGLKLYGEFIDFGFEKTALIIPGRNEGLRYSYFFAQAYPEMGYNVLVIDIRAHGKSEGIYDTVGYHERVDTIKWIELLKEKFGQKAVIIHGLCIGATTGFYVATDKNCPDILKAMVCEGPFTSFFDVITQRMKNMGKPIFPVRAELRYLYKKHAGVDCKKVSPINCAKDVKIPTLFICGKNDISSKPEKCRELFSHLGTEDKEIVWFEKGAHSHLRVNNIPEYDECIADFLSRKVK